MIWESNLGPARCEARDKPLCHMEFALNHLNTTGPLKEGKNTLGIIVLTVLSIRKCHSSMSLESNSQPITHNSSFPWTYYKEQVKCYSNNDEDNIKVPYWERRHLIFEHILALKHIREYVVNMHTLGNALSQRETHFCFLFRSMQKQKRPDLPRLRSTLPNTAKMKYLASSVQSNGNYLTCFSFNSSKIISHWGKKIALN